LLLSRVVPAIKAFFKVFLPRPLSYE